jgi:hypothetical protein
MISTLSSKIRIAIAVEDEQIVLICRKPTNDEMNHFLSARIVSRGRKVEQNFIPERVKLIDKILVDAENVGFENAAGEMAPLNASTVLTDADKAHATALLGVPVQTWKDMISVNWKCSAAMRFEEPVTEGEESGKN